MKVGLSTIQQTLTPEAAGVLNQSIAEAARRNHGQTTPLHVAATLLASPSGFLRQACIRSHPNSSHPLQCRALELCFSVALDRLPTAHNQSPNKEPPISNALMAALKRAQAHQRRGCPEQQQQPLLAVKVELEQFIISILDDPSVSRVMREASFSSPTVKLTIEQSLASQPCTNNTASASSMNCAPPKIGYGFRPASTLSPMIPPRNLYLNPRLQQQQQQQGNTAQLGQQREEEVQKVIEILSRVRKRNPVLVGEAEPEAVTSEVLRRIQMKQVGQGPLKDVVVISMDKDPAQAIPAKIKELGKLIEGRFTSSSATGGVIVDVGDLKWLVDQHAAFPGVASSGGPPLQQQAVSDAGHMAVAEIGKLICRFGGAGDGNGRLWLIGTATCETFLRCQVYHPTMENDWDLQVRSIAPRAPLPGIFPRIGSSGIRSCSSEPFSPLQCLSAAVPPSMRIASEKLDPLRKLKCCPQCLGNYEQELAKAVSGKGDKSVSEARQGMTRQPLPQWLQNTKLNNSDQEGTSDLPPQGQEQDLMRKQKSQELQKKWAETCLRLHPSFHKKSSLEGSVPTLPSVTSLCNPKYLVCQPLKPKSMLATSLGEDPLLNINSEGPTSPTPASFVTTDIVLGRAKTAAESTLENGYKGCMKDFLGVGCISLEIQKRHTDIQSLKPLAVADINSFKKLLKGLTEKVSWQKEAASALATAVTQCRVGNGKRLAAGSRGDIWLLFSGVDRIGKKKMAGALSELVFCVDHITIFLGSRRDGVESDLKFRGMTVIDRIAEAVRRNPFSVIMLQDIDEASERVLGSIRRAMERGRLADSHGREISLGNVIFILAADWMPENFQNLSQGLQLDEDKFMSLASGGWQLRLSVGERTSKRGLICHHDEDRVAKKPKETLSFDLNQMADAEDDRLDGSHNSSDLTVDHEVEQGHDHQQSPRYVWHELFERVDDAIFFKPVDLAPIRCNILTAITKKFSTIMGKELQLVVEQGALEKISSGIWLGQIGLEAWVEKVLVPSIQQLKASLPATCTEETLLARLELDSGSEISRSCGDDWLPSRIRVAIPIDGGLQ